MSGGDWEELSIHLERSGKCLGFDGDFCDRIVRLEGEREGGREGGRGRERGRERFYHLQNYKV